MTAKFRHVKNEILQFLVYVYSTRDISVNTTIMSEGALCSSETPGTVALTVSLFTCWLLCLGVPYPLRMSSLWSSDTLSTGNLRIKINKHNNNNNNNMNTNSYYNRERGGGCVSLQRVFVGCKATSRGDKKK